MSFRHKRTGFGVVLRSAEHGRLTREEEIELGRRVWDGDEEARDTLIACNITLVVAIAVRMQTARHSPEELASEGFFGLIEAVEKFEFWRGVRFASFAAFHIRAAMRHYIYTNEVVGTIPHHAGALLRKHLLLDATNLPMAETCPPVPGAALDAAVFHDPYYLDNTSRKQAIPLDEQEKPEPLLRDDFLIDRRIGQESTADRIASLFRAIDRLPDSDAEFVCRRFGLDGGEPAMVKDLAQAKGISRNTAGRHEAKILADLAVLMSQDRGE